MQVYSSVILVYGVTIRWLHFVHALSIYIGPSDQIDVWPGDEASTYMCLCTKFMYKYNLLFIIVYINVPSMFIVPLHASIVMLCVD